MNEVDEKVIGDIQAATSDYHDSSKDVESLQFWKALGEKHVSLVREFGFRNFKRTINFEILAMGSDRISRSQDRPPFQEASW